ncbi:hypothetical protein C1645_825414 [Glomus cerebriforme]|uniref:MIR domain-containing protein n=1 Tax=Glomus cerebriforme TaxID=658196 RepID=A0A397SZ14_9GLOM|nr:hypothetical protein C1645_825414 [Glomus cerebriforme]
MDIPKYDGNVHPDEWIKDIQKYFKLKKISYGHLEIAISLVDSTISLPTGINSLEELLDALKKDISFTVFKNTNKRKLQLLKYIPEREGGDTSKFVSIFRKLCFNAEINNIAEQTNIFFTLLPTDDYLLEIYKRKDKINSMNDLIKEFEEVVRDEANIIKDGSIVALKHVATGKYLNSNRSLRYKTGSRSQLVFAGGLDLWIIRYIKEYANQTDILITLQHFGSNKFLRVRYYGSYSSDNCYVNGYYKSPLTKNTEVSCGEYVTWKVNHKLKNHQDYLKSNDTFNLSIKKLYDNNGNYIQGSYYDFLRSHDVQFTIKNDTFQEVICHNKDLGINDEWCIELVKQA